jgi:RNA polymerase-binding transcription factor DksA
MCDEMDVIQAQQLELDSLLITAVRNQLPRGDDSAFVCEECLANIDEGRRKAIPGIRVCVICQERREQKKRIYAGQSR